MPETTASALARSAARPTAQRQTESDRLLRQYRSVRGLTERLAQPLSPEDQSVQSMADCSPTRWHRAHTTWFFETFLLQPRGVPPVHPGWGYLFNSYYEAIGPRHARPRRGVVSRPSTEQIGEYRREVDERVVRLLTQASHAELAAQRYLLQLGLAHEQQHQELLLTDIQNAFWENPLRPAYRGPPAAGQGGPAVPLGYREYEGGLIEIGAAPSATFHFDNEEPRHRVWLEPFELGNRLVTVGEWKAFAEDDGYSTPSLWLSAGIDWVRTHAIDAPLYGRREGGALVVFGLDGEREAEDAEPVTHLSYYEADALARFLDARLPTEAEWEHAAAGADEEGNFLEDEVLRALPAPASAQHVPTQLFGDAWEWTQSSYGAYPGYQPARSALGEYNGKFMANQFVLRGGSCFTPRGHVRASYRNFWPPDTRFQVTGVRLARSLSTGRGHR